MAEEKTGGDAWHSAGRHGVKKGQSPWKIAQQYYGDGNLYQRILAAHQDILSDPSPDQVGSET